jgi:hypothetical protein
LQFDVVFGVEEGACADRTVAGNAAGNRSGASSLGDAEGHRHEHRIKAGTALRKIIRRQRNSEELAVMICMRATRKMALRRTDLVMLGTEVS